MRRGTGGHQISDAGQPRQGGVAGTERQSQPGDLGQAPGDDRGYRVLPNPTPAAMPQLSAITFLHAPPTSQPTTSELV